MQRVDYPKRLFGDVYSMCLSGKSLALGTKSDGRISASIFIKTLSVGCSRKVTLVEDFDVARINNFSFLNTKSNVLSVHKSKVCRQS